MILFKIILERAPSAPRTEIELVNLIAEYKIERVLDYYKQNNTMKYLVR